MEYLPVSVVAGFISKLNIVGKSSPEGQGKVGKGKEWKIKSKKRKRIGE